MTSNKKYSLGWLMNIFFAALAFIVFKSVSSNFFSSSQKKDTEVSQFDSSSCKKSVTFGDIQICLPEIDGMKECYSIPNVRARVDDMNIVKDLTLAFYLNDATFKQSDKLEEFSFDDYFRVYGQNQLKGVKVGQKEMDKLVDIIKGNSLREHWDSFNEKIKKKFFDTLSVGIPVLMENYSPNSRIRTFVMLNKYQQGKNETVLLTTLDMIEVKERLIFLAYYKYYEGEESVKNAKSKNDYIALRFLEENK